ncbi:hypothetical protein N7463_006266 [Penicillium fimorum]|uniref:Myb-like DNA-binding domain-containing protein n=1 Tax=Penicillium fimorum TaxID=1882269 RepID=A0A9X0C605_9EURO|nr:hypothetical protein N7463_006266 [Penicillium fimorum]
MAQAIEKPEAPAPASSPTPTKLTAKLKLKGPANPEAEAPRATEALPKASDEEFLLTLLEQTKIDYEAATQRLGINKAACRMRLIRLQQKHGFTKVEVKGIPQGKKRAANANKKAGPTSQLPAAADKADAVEDGKKDTDMKEATEN